MAHTRSKLEHSLSLLKATLDATTDAILVVDAAGRVMQYNTEFARMWQIDRELLNADTQSAPLRRILNGTDLQDDAETRWFEVRRDPERHAYDELLLSDGRIIERHQMTEYRDGIAVGQIWHFRDITERKASETPLAQLSFGMDQMRDAAYLIDNDARIIYANRHACLELGYSREQLRGMRVEDVDPAHTDTIWRTHWQALKASGSLTLETLHQTKDGRLFPVEVVANFFEYANTGYNLAIARNISERKRIEEVLQQAALIYQNSSEAMLLADAEGRIIAVNPAFTQITGHCREEIEGQSIDLINTEDHRKAMWQSVRKSGFWQGEVWDRTQSGDRYAKWLTVNAIKDSEGRIFRLVALFADITEKNRPRT
ncbi:PAS domain S-box protein [Methylomonas sp. CM2]|uniref:PAS domain S-box protein n=1 Tax=Methylomonas sp. CM2 TaxID=3417647 RepID=UPI003CEE7E71